MAPIMHSIRLGRQTRTWKGVKEVMLDKSNKLDYMNVKAYRVISLPPASNAQTNADQEHPPNNSVERGESGSIREFLESNDDCVSPPIYRGQETHG